MTDSTAAQAPGPVFSLRPAKRGFDIPQAMKWVRQTYGKSSLRQFVEILEITTSDRRMQPMEYYLYGMFRPEFDRARRRSYVTHFSNMAIGEWLSPSKDHRQDALISNKVLTTSLFEHEGIPIVPISALFSRAIRLPSLRALETPDAITAYLAEPDAVPCFGKPVFGSTSVGTVSIVGTSDNGATLHLGDGREVPASRLADDIARYFPEGYIFQPLIRQHPTLESVNGPAVGVLRVVTLLAQNGPEPLYAVLRMPPAGVMSDGSASSSKVGLAHVDLESGAILHAQNMAKIATSPQTESLATGLPLAGVTLPFMDKAREACVRIHGMFPAHGQLAHDVALTPDGPVLTEINARPYHALYQRSADHGVLNPEFAPRFRRAATLARVNSGIKGIDPGSLIAFPKRLG